MKTLRGFFSFLKSPDFLSWAIALLAVGVIVGGAFVTLAALRPDPDAVRFESTDVSGVSWGRNFHLIGDDGTPRSLGDFRGKAVALYFGYTRCPDVCPTTLATLAQAARLLRDDAPRVKTLFVSVDARRDSPEVLRKYVRSFSDDFLGLYGDAKAIALTTSEFRVEAGEHHSIPVFLFDTSGRLRLVAHPDASAESIAHDLRALLAEPAQPI
jgi:protein SCO1/2